VIIHRGKIEILDRIYFARQKTDIQPVSFPLVDAIAATLKGNPQIAADENPGPRRRRRAGAAGPRARDQRVEGTGRARGGGAAPGDPRSFGRGRPCARRPPRTAGRRTPGRVRDPQCARTRSTNDRQPARPSGPPARRSPLATVHSSRCCGPCSRPGAQSESARAGGGRGARGRAALQPSARPASRWQGGAGAQGRQRLARRTAAARSWPCSRWARRWRRRGTGRGRRAPTAR
jgi:hypothetical protein